MRLYHDLPNMKGQIIRSTFKISGTGVNQCMKLPYYDLCVTGVNQCMKLPYYDLCDTGVNQCMKLPYYGLCDTGVNQCMQSMTLIFLLFNNFCSTNIIYLYSFVSLDLTFSQLSFVWYDTVGRTNLMGFIWDPELKADGEDAPTELSKGRSSPSR